MQHAFFQNEYFQINLVAVEGFPFTCYLSQWDVLIQKIILFSGSEINMDKSFYLHLLLYSIHIVMDMCKF